MSSTTPPFKSGTGTSSPVAANPVSEQRQLLMRANRMLGSALIEHNLVKFENLEAANERLIELSSKGDYRQATILGILINDKKVLKEEDVIHLAQEEQALGAVDLRHYDVPEDIRKDMDIPMCWATWTIPYDREEDFHFVATAYYFSQAVRTYWEKRLKGQIIWQTTSMDIIAEFLDKLHEERSAALAKLASARPATR